MEDDDNRVFSTNISPHPSGMPWDAETFIEVMRTGKHGGLHHFMPWIAFRDLNDEDLRATHAFLQTMQPVAHFISNHAAPTPCAVCGQSHGLGELNHPPAEPEGILIEPGSYDRYLGSYYSAEWDYTHRFRS